MTERGRVLRACFQFCNKVRLRWSLEYRTPAKVFRAGRPEELAKK